MSVAQKEHHHIYPRPGWVEHDPEEIWGNVEFVVGRALAEARLEASDLVALGIANQRETTLVWDRATGQAVHNAINWQDMRTDHIVRDLSAQHGDAWFRERSGLPPATYFSGPKLRWLLDTVPGLRERAVAGEVLFGTMDSWLIWRLTGRHLTDVTNASRTMLMGLHTLDWDDELLDALGVPRQMLPEIRPSAEIYGDAGGQLAGVPVAAALGDQQAALFGQTCFAPGDAKCTYGTGSFLLLNTGERPVVSDSGLLTTLVLSRRRRGADLRAGGIDRGDWRARAVVSRQPHADRVARPRSRRWRARWKTTVAATSSRRSPDSSLPIGAAMRAASSPA